eukprot:3426818-Pleurochrysis_carterae.AAC.1
MDKASALQAVADAEAEAEEAAEEAFALAAIALGEFSPVKTTGRAAATFNFDRLDASAGNGVIEAGEAAVVSNLVTSAGERSSSAQVKITLPSGGCSGGSDCACAAPAAGA